MSIIGDSINLKFSLNVEIGNNILLNFNKNVFKLDSINILVKNKVIIIRVSKGINIV